MSKYMLGLDVLGRGGGGGHGGGGHGGGGHGGHGGHGGGNRGRRVYGFWPYGSTYYYDDEHNDTQCLEYDRYGNCLVYASPNIEVFGMFDIAARQRQMNELKQVPVSVAQILLRGGQQAIDHARALAASKNLPGGGARDKVYWALKWHETELSKLKDTPTAMYASGEDLKKFVMQSFIEANAADEGAVAIDQMWSAMWADIGHAIAALPAAVVAKVSEVVDTAETTAKWTLVIVAGVVGLLGYGAYKILQGPTGQAAVGAYLPRGRR